MGAENVQLDSSHCRAICDEIGERLRMILDREAAPLPPRLQLLMLRLFEQDMNQAPSIASAIDDIVSMMESTEHEPSSIGPPDRTPPRPRHFAAGVTRKIRPAELSVSSHSAPSGPWRTSRMRS